MCNIKSGINELCEMANMPGVGLEIFKAGGGWRDQKWAPPRSVKLPSLRQGRVQTSLALWAGGAHAPRRWSGESLFFLRGRGGEGCFTLSPKVQGRGSLPPLLTPRDVVDFVNFIPGRVDASARFFFLKRFLIAVATRTARPFRLRCPLPSYLDFRLLYVEAPCLPSRFEISTHGGSYTLIHHRRFEYYEPHRHSILQFHATALFLYTARQQPLNLKP
ncbi:hypothetical protein T11_4306, partial [Trichinella zimbabwensis]